VGKEEKEVAIRDRRNAKGDREYIQGKIKRGGVREDICARIPGVSTVCVDSYLNP
jgi:hypothetical protein